MQNRVTKTQAINLKKLGYDVQTNTVYEDGLDAPQLDQNKIINRKTATK